MYSSTYIFDSPVKRTTYTSSSPIEVRSTTYNTPLKSSTITTTYDPILKTTSTKTYDDYVKPTTYTSTYYRPSTYVSSYVPSYTSSHYPITSDLRTSRYTSYGPGYRKDVTYTPSTYSTSTTYESPLRSSTIKTTTYESPLRSSTIKTTTYESPLRNSTIRTTTTYTSPLTNSYSYRSLSSAPFRYYDFGYSYGKPWRSYYFPSTYYTSYYSRPSYLVNERRYTTYSYDTPRTYTTTTYVDPAPVVEKTTTVAYDDYLPSSTLRTVVRDGLVDKVVETTTTPTSTTTVTRAYDPYDIASKYDTVVKSTYYY